MNIDQEKQNDLNRQLFFHSRKGNLTLMKSLVEQGADFSFSRKILSEACGNGYLNIVQYLIENGVNVNVEDQNSNEIQMATQNGHLDIVKYLVENGLNTVNGHHLLFYTSKTGHVELAKYLIENGADINEQNNFALKSAAYNGHLEIVKLFIQKGQKKYEKDKELFNELLFDAVDQGHLDILNYLIKEGVDIHEDNDIAIKNAFLVGHLQLTQHLVIEHNCDINVALNQAKLVNQKEIIDWCEKYINSKELNNKLDVRLDKKDTHIKRKKI